MINGILSRSMRTSILKQAGPLFASIILANTAGFIGAIFTAESVNTWYATLTKPSFNPPSWVFGPVWTLLYCLMGIAAFLVWKKGYSRQETRLALGIYGVQLVLNSLWSFLFFKLHNLAFALLEIGLLWISIVATIWLFSRISRKAAYLLLPYLAWVSFASILNYALWQRNT